MPNEKSGQSFVGEDRSAPSIWGAARALKAYIHRPHAP